MNILQRVATIDRAEKRIPNTTPRRHSPTPAPMLTNALVQMREAVDAMIQQMDQLVPPR